MDIQNVRCGRYEVSVEKMFNEKIVCLQCMDDEDHSVLCMTTAQARSMATYLMRHVDEIETGREPGGAKNG